MSISEIRTSLSKISDRWASYSGTESSASQTFLNALVGAYTGADDALQAGARWSGNPMNLVFTSQLGHPLAGRNVLRTIQKASIGAGLDAPRSREKIGVHTLRHVVSTRLLDGGVPMHTVSRILGHDSIDTTVNTYGHLVEAGRKSAMELLSYEAGRTHQQSVH